MLEKLNPIDVNSVNKANPETKKTSHVVQSLQDESESTTPQQTFRFTKEQVKWISYLIDKHCDDYQVRLEGSGLLSDSGPPPIFVIF